MASLEEIMAGLFGSTGAAGAQGLRAPAADTDPRRRRAGQGSGYGGIAGGEVSLSQLIPHLQGLRSYDYSGPMGGGGGMRGLGDLISGPAARHMQSQGPQGMPPGLAAMDQLPPGLAQQGDLPPGLDNREPVGGKNVAPGNVGTGLSINQPGADAGRMAPHSQGWRNVAPGYSAAAQFGFGTPEFGRLLVEGAQGGPAGGGGPPGLRGAEGGGQGVRTQGGGGGGGGAVTPAPAPGRSGGGGDTGGGGGGGYSVPAKGGRTGPGYTGPRLKGGSPAPVKANPKKSPSVSKGTGGPTSPTQKFGPVKQPKARPKQSPSTSKGTGGPITVGENAPTPVAGKTPSVSKGTGGPINQTPGKMGPPKPVAPRPGKTMAKKQQI
jgi:hypothetical protein